MTITQKMSSPTSTTIQGRSGFAPIPTRIRDTREAREVPPLVVGPANDAQREAVVQALGELAQKLAEIHRTAAEAYMSQTMYEQALPHLDAAATFASGEAEYHHQLGFVRYITGDDVGAVQAFNTVLSSDANNTEAWFNLGMVLFGQSQFGEAEDCFRRSIETGNNDGQTWNNRGVCLWQQQRGAEARTCFEKALQIDPNDQDARYNLASI